MIGSIFGSGASFFGAFSSAFAMPTRQQETEVSEGQAARDTDAAIDDVGSAASGAVEAAAGGVSATVVQGAAAVEDVTAVVEAGAASAVGAASSVADGALRASSGAAYGLMTGGKAEAAGGPQPVLRAEEAAPEEDALAEARARAIAAQEEFTRSKLLAEMGSLEEGGLASRLGRGAEGYTAARDEMRQASQPARASIEV